MLENDIKDFIDKKVKGKDLFYVESIPKQSAYMFINKYHYLKDAKFFSEYQYGLFYKPTTELVGVATFSLPQGIVALQSWFNLSNSVTNIFELSRLCVLPVLNNTNATSLLLGGGGYGH